MSRENFAIIEKRGIIEPQNTNEGEPLLRIPELSASRVSEKIEAGEFSTKLSHQQHLKHVEGTPQFNQYKASRLAKGMSPQSVLTITESEAQELIRTKAGTGIVAVGRETREMLPRESITVDRVIGKTWSGTEYIDTNKARIHYGKKVSHIVPIGGKNYD